MGQEISIDTEIRGTLAERVTLYICEPYKNQEEATIAAFESLFSAAVCAYNDLKVATKALDDNNVEYNNVMMS